MPFLFTLVHLVGLKHLLMVLLSLYANGSLLRDLSRTRLRLYCLRLEVENWEALVQNIFISVKKQGKLSQEVSIPLKYRFVLLKQGGKQDADECISRCDDCLICVNEGGDDLKV